MVDVLFTHIVLLGILGWLFVLAEAVYIIIRGEKIGRAIKENINFLVPANLIGVLFASYILYLFPAMAGFDTIRMNDGIVNVLCRLSIDNTFIYILLNPVFPALAGTWICFLIARRYFPKD